MFVAKGTVLETGTLQNIFMQGVPMIIFFSSEADLHIIFT